MKQLLKIFFCMVLLPFLSCGDDTKPVETGPEMEKTLLKFFNSNLWTIDYYVDSAEMKYKVFFYNGNFQVVNLTKDSLECLNLKRGQYYVDSGR